MVVTILHNQKLKKSQSDSYDASKTTILDENTNIFPNTTKTYNNFHQSISEKKPVAKYSFDTHKDDFYLTLSDSTANNTSQLKSSFSNSTFFTPELSSDTIFPNIKTDLDTRESYTNSNEIDSFSISPAKVLDKTQPESLSPTISTFYDLYSSDIQDMDIQSVSYSSEVSCSDMDISDSQEASSNNSNESNKMTTEHSLLKNQNLQREPSPKNIDSNLQEVTTNNQIKDTPQNIENTEPLCINNENLFNTEKPDLLGEDPAKDSNPKLTNNDKSIISFLDYEDGSFINNSEFALVFSTLSLLKQQVCQALSDLKSLEVLKDCALSNPSMYISSTLSGKSSYCYPKPQDIACIPAINLENHLKYASTEVLENCNAGFCEGLNKNNQKYDDQTDSNITSNEYIDVGSELSSSKYENNFAKNELIKSPKNNFDADKNSIQEDPFTSPKLESDSFLSVSNRSKSFKELSSIQSTNEISNTGNSTTQNNHCLLKNDSRFTKNSSSPSIGNNSAEFNNDIFGTEKLPIVNSNDNRDLINDKIIVNSPSTLHIDTDSGINDLANILVPSALPSPLKIHSSDINENDINGEHLGDYPSKKIDESNPKIGISGSSSKPTSKNINNKISKSRAKYSESESSDFMPTTKRKTKKKHSRSRFIKYSRSSLKTKETLNSISRNSILTSTNFSNKLKKIPGINNINQRNPISKAVSSGYIPPPPSVYNKPWDDEEQARLQELLEIYPDEPISNNRWRKISEALGTRTMRQVASRVQKYFIKLNKAGLPIPGRLPDFSKWSSLDKNAKQKTSKTNTPRRKYDIDAVSETDSTSDQMSRNSYKPAMSKSKSTIPYTGKKRGRKPKSVINPVSDYISEKNSEVDIKTSTQSTIDDWQRKEKSIFSDNENDYLTKNSQKFSNGDSINNTNLFKTPNQRIKSLSKSEKAPISKETVNARSRGRPPSKNKPAFGISSSYNGNNRIASQSLSKRHGINITEKLSKETSSVLESDVNVDDESDDFELPLSSLLETASMIIPTNSQPSLGRYNSKRNYSQTEHDNEDDFSDSIQSSSKNAHKNRNSVSSQSKKPLSVFAQSFYNSNGLSTDHLKKSLNSENSDNDKYNFIGDSYMYRKKRKSNNLSIQNHVEDVPASSKTKKNIFGFNSGSKKRESGYIHGFKLSTLTNTSNISVRKSVLHIGYCCDSCYAEPIVGTRWHCIDCSSSRSSAQLEKNSSQNLKSKGKAPKPLNDFDLCDDCMTENNAIINSMGNTGGSKKKAETEFIHNHKHRFIRITEPDFDPNPNIDLNSNTNLGDIIDPVNYMENDISHGLSTEAMSVSKSKGLEKKSSVYNHDNIDATNDEFDFAEIDSYQSTLSSVFKDYEYLA
ncbi:hypothetical protein BB558_003018 [Smittium angustum]|uniref:Uncharacterized protein n=1 Tax=Smittium angustum TaxID=133377 RepID=A0A2U1J776_SMIAN|nr:hypothetical protein BB558_003018 [Smittium angustum]